MELAPSNPQESLQVAVQDLARAMEIGLYLVDNEILPSVRGLFLFFSTKYEESLSNLSEMYLYSVKKILIFSMTNQNFVITWHFAKTQLQRLMT